MDCNYVISINHCRNPATYVIIWGCLEDHINEFVVCGHHQLEWIRAHNASQINCATCYHPSADYLTIELDQINPTKLHI